MRTARDGLTDELKDTLGSFINGFSFTDAATWRRDFPIGKIVVSCVITFLRHF